MGVGLSDNSSEASGLSITTAHEAKVALQEALTAGFATMSSEKFVNPRTGNRIVREVEATEDFQLRTALANLWFTDFNPVGTAINTSLWQTIATTQTVTLGNARYELNSSGITTINTGSMMQSRFYVPFYKANATYPEFALTWTAAPVQNWFAEWGVGDATTFNGAHTNGVFFRIINSILRGVLVQGGVDVATVDIMGADGLTLPEVGNVHNYSIEITTEKVNFFVDDQGYELSVPPANFAAMGGMSLPVFMRTYNGGVAPATAIKLQVSAIAGSNEGADLNRLWSTTMSTAGYNSIQGPTGATVGQSANYTNSAAPSSATLSNTAAGYTTLGGQFQFAAVAGAETDYALFAYQVPAGKTLVVEGVTIDTVNTGAAVATSATLLQWALSAGATAASLATGEAATTKAPRRLPLGFQTFPIGAAIAAQALPINSKLTSPVVANSGEFFHIILKMPVGTATASQVIRGVVQVNGYFQ